MYDIFCDLNSILGVHLRLFSRRIYGDEEILHITHDLLIMLRWFSVGSYKTIAHWTFFCPPDGKSNNLYENIVKFIYYFTNKYYNLTLTKYV